MNQFNPLPPLEELKEAFAYDPDTGLFTHRRTSRRICKGDVAGTSVNGYIRIRFYGLQYAAHRMAWLFSTGNDPAERMLDHKDRVRSHNWISNLRLTTNATNQANTLSRGWIKSENRYRACMTIDRKRIYLGTYDTPEEASAVFQKKHIEVYGEFSPYLAQ